MLDSDRCLVLGAMTQRQGHRHESLAILPNSAFMLPTCLHNHITQRPSTQTKVPHCYVPYTWGAGGKSHWRGCQATRTEEILRRRRGETLQSRSFSTAAVAGNETGLQSASPVPSGSSRLRKLYTSRFHLDHGAWSSKIFLLFKYFTNTGHGAFDFRKTLNMIRPGTSYYLVHLPQSALLPNRHSVGNSA